MENEEVIMQLIMHGGEARAKSLKAIDAAERGAFGESEDLISEAKEAISQAHEVQTRLIQAEIRGENQSASLLMVHAQDHVMNAMTVHDLAQHMIANIRIVQDLTDHLAKQ